RLAADAIAVVPEDCRADRAGDEAHRVDREGFEHADQRIGVREEQLAEDQAGHGAVEEKVIPFDRRADRAGNHCLAKLRTMLGLRQLDMEDTGYAHGNASLISFCMAEILNLPRG